MTGESDSSLMDTMFFNEHDAFAATWLRNLWPNATVDERCIREVRADELVRFERCHFFGGVGGWQLALELAGWPEGREIWTGSCPCQPFSDAGKKKGTADERHLWPEFFRLIRLCRPAVVFGEQVASKDGLRWLDGVFADLEGAGYACGAADLCAASVGQEVEGWIVRGNQADWERTLVAPPHIRQRLFLVAAIRVPDAGSERGQQGPEVSRAGRKESVAEHGRGLGDTDINGCQPGQRTTQANGHGHSALSAGIDGLVIPQDAERGPNDGDATGRQWQAALQLGDGDSWSDFRVIPCRDEKARRVSAQPGDESLADGIPHKNADPRLGYLVARLVELGHDPKAARRIIREARGNRIGRLRGYGNAIVPQLAAMFVRAFLETEGGIENVV